MQMRKTSFGDFRRRDTIFTSRCLMLSVDALHRSFVPESTRPAMAALPLLPTLT
jgi:hypothetical protein